VSGRCCPSVRTIALQLYAISILRLERPNHVDWRFDDWTFVAHYFHIKACASGPRRLTSRRLKFVCTTFLIKDSVRMGTHIVRMVAAVFPYLCLGTKSFSLSNTERRLDRWKLEQIEASRHKGISRRKVLVVRTNDALTVERSDGILRRPDGCKGSNSFDLESVQNLLETLLWNEDSKNNWIPDNKHHYKEVILSNRMQPITN
jgi:hypothetical protein